MPEKTVESPFLTLDEAAQYAKCNVETIKRRAQEGHLQLLRPAGHGRVLVDRRELENYLRGKNRKVKA
jgi:excisionase family DNA binding protein